MLYMTASENQAWLEKFLPTYTEPKREDYKSSGDVMYHCPFHDDKNKSFAFKAETGEWYCHAEKIGGGKTDLANLLGIPPHERGFTNTDYSTKAWKIKECKQNKKKEPALPEANWDTQNATRTLYDYVDASGKLLYQVVRHDAPGYNKSIRSRRPDGNGGWINKISDIPDQYVPYRLPELLAAIDRGERVYVAEGEKCVDALYALGLTATTNHGGCKKWSELHTKHFKLGSNVYIFYDNDNPGRDHRDRVASSLSAAGCNVYVVDLGYDDSPENKGKDVADWLSEGNTLDDLNVLIDSAKPYRVDLLQEEDASATDHESILSDIDNMPFPDDFQGVDVHDKSKRKKAYSGPSDMFGVVGGYRMNDVGNAQRLIDAYGKDLRYCNGWKKWLTWDSKRWSENRPDLPNRYCSDVVEEMYKDADDIEDQDARSAFLSYACRSGNANKLKAMLTVAESIEGVPVAPEELDKDSMVINCQNGTLDLRTGFLRPHSRDELITKITNANYNPNAKCDTWERFLHKIMGGDNELIQFLRRSVGYALTGSMKEQCFFILYGTGRNGKSTFLNTLRWVLGDYAMQSASETFMEKKNASGPSDDIAALRGARMVTSIETSENKSIAESIVKQVTGGDALTVRRLYQDYFQMEPEFKIFLATNHKPKIKGSDDGIWRRIRLIPFNVRIPDDDVDLDLMDKLRDEKDGIFKWAVEGCVDWHMFNNFFFSTDAAEFGDQRVAKCRRRILR